MNYYNVVIQINNAGESTQTVYKFDTRDAAIASFHTEMAYGINAGLNGVTCIVVDQQGALHMTDSWSNPAAVVVENAGETNS